MKFVYSPPVSLADLQWIHVHYVNDVLTVQGIAEFLIVCLYPLFEYVYGCNVHKNRSCVVALQAPHWMFIQGIKMWCCFSVWSVTRFLNVRFPKQKPIWCLYASNTWISWIYKETETRHRGEWVCVSRGGTLIKTVIILQPCIVWFTYLLYNCGELKTKLDHVVSGHRVISHCSKWRPEKEGAPGMNH